MKIWCLSVALLIALVGVVPKLCIAADKIRISVTRLAQTMLPI